MAQRMAGWTLPGYEVEELVGFGSVGEVWRARERATGQLVALKRLRGGGGPADRDRLCREAAVLCGVVGPHLVRLRTVLATADGLVLVLDYAAGGSLAGLLAVRRRLTPGEVVGVAGPLAAALAGVHAAGVVHGDVSPANVLFDHVGRPLLADLGVARLRADGAPAAVTVAYADPAVLRGDEPSPASDVYGLAAVCHAALTGAPPYPGTDPDTVLQLVTAGRRRSLHDALPFVPPALADAVEAALVTDPADRPDAAALAARLAAALRAVPVRLGGASVRVSSPSTVRIDTSTSATPAPPALVMARPSVVGLTAPFDAELPAPDPLPTTAPGAIPRRPAPVSRSPWHGRWRQSGEPHRPRRSRRDSPRWRATGRPHRRRLRRGRPGPERMRGGRHVRPSAGAAGRARLLAGAVAAALGAAVVAGLAWARSGGAPVGTSAADDSTAGVTLPAMPSDPTGPGPTIATAPPHPVTTTSPAAPHAVTPGTPEPSPAPRTTVAATGGRTALPSRAELLGALRRLDGVRGAAFAHGDVTMLARVYVTGSPAWRADRSTLQRLVSAGEHAEGLAPRVTSLAVLAGGADHVTVRVGDVLPPYRIVDRLGLVATQPGRGPRAWVIELAAGPGGWRISSVRSAQDAPSADHVGPSVTADAAAAAGPTGRAPPRTGPPLAAP